MDRCSLFEFSNALNMPYKLFTTLRHIEADTTTLTRSKYFAECHITDMGRPALLYAPIERESLLMAHHANVALHEAYGHGFITMMFRTDEMLHLNTSMMQLDVNSRCTLIMEYLPEGDLLEVAINTMSREQLLAGLEYLDATLRKCNISHNNLTPRNIIVDRSNRWLPIRQYYTTRGYGGDKAAMEHLRELIYKHTTPTPEIDPASLGSWYREPTHPIDAYLEGRRQFKTERGVGFKDENGVVIIDDKYLWASDFMENRAMVMTMDNRMGVIDNMGREVIAPIYDSVRYSVDSGKTIVSINGLCAVFDYEGQQITEWVEIDKIVK